MDPRRYIAYPLDHDDDENHIPASSGSSSPCDSTIYSSDDEINNRNKRQAYMKRPTSVEPKSDFDLILKQFVENYPIDGNSSAKVKNNIDKQLSGNIHNNDFIEDANHESRVFRMKPTARDMRNTLRWDDIPNYLDDSHNQLVDDGDSILSPTEYSGARSSRNPVNQLCAKLLECRNLIEAIEFVEQNRNMIDLLTSIIREAPAYRNYDFSLYQIDHSVKDSFNPNFWSDRKPIQTTADGNCQYHAVSLSLTGTELYTPQVRLATAVAVIDHREWFDQLLQFIDGGTVLDLVYTIVRNYSWGDETTLKAIAVAINRRIFLYTCNLGKKDYELVKSLNREELLDAFREKKYRGGTGIHAYADPLNDVNSNNYIMLFHKSEHFIAVLPEGQQLTMYEPFNPILPVFS